LCLKIQFKHVVYSYFILHVGQSQDKQNILSADIIFGSPEALLSSEWKDKLNDLNITVIVIDEFHLIATWRISMMKPFLGDNDLEQLKLDIGDHTCCDICQQECTCKNCALLTLEKLLTGQDCSSYQYDEELSDTSDEMSDEIIDDNKSDFEP
ncbi:hypothetical protein FSP39_017154, partial [Pinctada imbricata]